MTASDKLAELGYALSKPPAPAATYVPVTRIGNTLFVSGQVSTGPNGLIKGTLGKTMSTAEGQKAAAQCAVNILSQIAFNADVPLGKVRMVKLTVLVSSTPDFIEHHIVGNGASDLLVAVLGDNGRHARAAFGVAALPTGAAVEVEAVAEVLA